MVGVEFLEQVSKLQVASYVGVEDFADKFNFLITVLVIMLCTTTVTVKQYMMKPISCYMATDIGGRNLLDYVENYCWVQGTIPIAYSAKIPDDEASWKELNSKKLLYYQWVPFVLGLQCILFYLPRLIWQMICYNRSGTDVQHLVTSASQAVHSNEEQRTKLVKHLAKTLEQMLFQTREINEKERRIDRARHWLYKYASVLTVHKRLGNRLWGTYLVIKILYLANAVGQLFLMRDFLGFKYTNSSFFGAEIARNILEGKDWETTLVFPRVGFCIARIQHMAGPNFVAAQCVLPVNMLNERIYVFLWFWIFLAAIITGFSIPMWFMRMTYMKTRTCYIKKFLKLGEAYSKEDKLMVDKFCRQFLRHDGVFLLRMISLNSGELITSEIVCQLWNIFKKLYASRKFLYDADDPQELQLDDKKHAGKASTTNLSALLPNGPHKFSVGGNSLKDGDLPKGPVIVPSAPPSYQQPESALAFRGSRNLPPSINVSSIELNEVDPSKKAKDNQV